MAKLVVLIRLWPSFKMWLPGGKKVKNLDEARSIAAKRMLEGIVVRFGHESNRRSNSSNTKSNRGGKGRSKKTTEHKTT